MSIHKRETKTGVRYDVKLRDPTGRMYQRSFRTKRQAEAYEAKQRVDRHQGAWIDPRGAEMTFEQWAIQWLGLPGKRPSTLAADGSRLKVHLLPALGPRRLGSITPSDVQRLVNRWATQHTPATVERMYGVLRAILGAAVRAELLMRSPCRGIRLPAVERAKRRVVGPEDLVRLADAIDVRYRAMVLVAGVLGLRFGECAALRVTRLDLARSTLSVVENLTRGPGGALVLGPPKSRASHRSMTVPSWLVDELREHLASRGLSEADPDAFVFTSPEGGPLQYSNFRCRIWLPACRAVGLDGLGFHDLRRAAATALVLSGVDVRTAQHRLGHTDPRITLGIYAQVTADGDRAAAERLGAHFLRPGPSPKQGEAPCDEPRAIPHSSHVPSRSQDV